MWSWSLIKGCKHTVFMFVWSLSLSSSKHTSSHVGYKTSLHQNILTNLRAFGCNQRWLFVLFLLLSDFLIHAESLSVSQSTPPPSPPPPVSPVRHWESLMLTCHIWKLFPTCCRDISLLTFRSQEAGCEAPVTVWKEDWGFCSTALSWWMHSEHNPRPGVKGSFS